MYEDVANNLNKFIIQYPKTIVPSPTAIDYQNGFIERYFVRKANDSNGHIFEVNYEIFAEYSSNPFWISDRMLWRITGPIEAIYKEDGTMDDRGVRASNSASIGLASVKLKNIGLYLPNLLQFRKS